MTVAAAQDVDTTNDTATLSHSASGGGYNSVTGDLAVTVTDDDSPSVTVAETGGGTAVTEGGGDEDTFTVVLDTRPVGAVAVAAAAGSGIELDGPDAGTAFSASAQAAFSNSQNGLQGSWNVPRTFRVRATTASENGTDTPGSRTAAQVTFTTNDLLGTAYDGLTVDPLPVAVIDNDPTSVTLARTDSGVVAEGGTATLTVALGRDLIANETVTAPLTVSGTGVTDGDYTLALSTGGSLNNGVTLSTSSPHSAAQPAVVFTGSDTGTQQMATLTLTAATDGDANETLSIGFGSVTSNLDLADASTSGTGGTTTAGAPVAITIGTVDTAAPTATLTNVPAKINDRTPFTATVTFNEPVTGFAANDITVAGGAKGAFTPVSTTEYTLVVTPAGGGAAVVVTVLADSATDGNSNTGPAAAVVETAVWDATAPTLDITGLPDKINDRTARTVTFTFSEAVTGFATGDVSVSGGAKGAFAGDDGDTEYTLLVTPAGSADVVVTVAANAATDGANTGPASQQSETAEWDTTAPTLSITGLPDKINDRTPRTVTFTFSEAVTGFATGDVTVSGGVKGAFTGADGDTEYTLLVTPNDGADVTVTVAANAATDGANTGPASQQSETAEWDATAPTLAISGLPEKINDRTVRTVTFTFSKAVTGFATGDVSVSGGVKGAFTGGDGDTEYTLSVTPNDGADVTVTVAANAATDGANTAPASQQSETAEWDATAPTLEISGLPASIDSTAALTATFTFSEAVTGFAADDITVTGGTAGAFASTSATVYTLMVTPAGSADVVVTVRAAAATDGLNTGPASAEEATAAWEPPAAPMGLTATPGNARVFLNWTNPSDSDIDKYQVRQGTGTTVTWGGWTDIGSSMATTTTHTVTGLDNDTEYSFQIRAVDGSAESAESNTATATPMAPVTLTIDPAAPTVIEGDDTHAVFTLRLSAPRATATAVTVVTIGTGASENSDFVPGPFTVTIDAGKTEATLRIEILDDNFDVNDDDETFNVLINVGNLPDGVTAGTPSRATVTIRDDDAPPPAPAGLTAEAGDGRVVLGWTYAPPAVDRTSGFEYRARAGTAAWGAWTAVPGGAGRRGHTVTGLVNGTAHTFEVRARTRNGMTGPASAQATATPDSEASVLAAEARAWSSEDSCDTDCGDRLRRAIKALGGSGDDLAGVVPLTYREAEALAFTDTDMVWRERWGEVAKALRGLEADRIRVSIAAVTAGPVAEGAELTFRLTASGAPPADLAVSVAVEDVQASPGAQRVSDFVADAVREVTIQSGQTTAVFTVRTVDDTAQEPGGFVNATLRGSLDYAPGARWGASVEVADNDAGGAPVPVVGVSGGPSVTEGGNAEFTLRAVPAPDSPLPVRVAIAQDGDFAASGQTGARTVTIGTGGAATFTVGTEDDAIDEEDGAIRAAVSAGAGYTVGDAEASVAVVDNDGDPPTPPSTTFTPNSDLVEEIQQWRGETQHGQEHIDRWTRVLIALGVETGSDLEPMPSGEAQGYADRGWTRWVDVVTELKLKEAHDAQPVTPVTPPPALPTVTVAGDGAVTEGAGAAFTVSRTGGTAEALTVLLAVSEDTSGGRDFVAADDEGNKQVVIQAGSATATLTVPTTADSVDEPDGTVTLALRTSSAYTRGAPSSGTVAVSDDDGATPPPPPVLPAITVAAAADGPVTEGGTLSFTLRASAAPAADLTVSYKVADAAGGDFVASGGEGQRTAVIAAGQTSVDVTVATTADSTDEPDGQVAVTVAAGEGYTVGTPATAETAVADDDATTVTLSGPSGDIAEAGGAKTFTVTLGRAPVAGEWVRVPLMLGGTATRAADWTATCAQAPGVRCFGLNSSDRPSIDFFFATGEGASATATVTLTAVADTVDEGAGETVTVALGTPETNASGGATGTGTLGFTISDDDDPLPAVSAEAGAGVTEGMDAVFTLTVSPAPAAADLTVSYTVADADGADFLLRASEGANTVVIGAGATSASVTVPTVADSTDEPDGEVTLTLAAGAGYRLGAASATVAVSDDDATAGPTLSISDAQVAEGGNMPFTITLSAPSRERVCFDARTRDSAPPSATAGADADYTPNLWNASRYLPCFPPGHTALRLWIKTWKDAHDESDETFEMVLSNPRGATIADAVGVGTICDRNNTAQCPPVETDTDVLRSPDGFAAGGLAAEPAAEPQTGPGPRARSAPRLEPRFEPPAAACVPPELLSEVRAHAGASRRPAAAERWLRVLHTFTGAANDATIMLSAEARTYLDPGRPEWAPVVAAIQCLEARAMR